MSDQPEDKKPLLSDNEAHSFAPAQPTISVSTDIATAEIRTEECKFFFFFFT